MGSGFAGVKSGVLAGIVYIGSIALFNVLLLYLLKQDVLTIITQQNPQACPTGTNAPTNVEDCFNSVLVGYIPFVAFFGFFISLAYSWIFGRLYEYFPGVGAKSKGVTAGVIVLLNLVLFGLWGVPFEETAARALGIFVVLDTAVYGVLLGWLYRRYTRLVEFGKQEQAQLRIIVDGRDYTGKSRTFAAKSVHAIRAEGSEGNSFKAWIVSGGVTVEDSKSYETTMEVNGDGLLKAISKKG